MNRSNTILVVDDSEINRELLRGILEEKYDVLEAADGLEALEMLKAHDREIEGVVLDLIMPRMDGYTFLDRYSREEKWNNIPVLVTTADEDADVENKCLRLGAWDFVHKPYNSATVMLRLQNTISRREMRLMERQRITNVFQKYVEPSVLEELLREGVSDGELQGKNVEVAVLFADIRGFTSLSERLDPEQVVELLNDFLTLTSSAINRYSGTLDKFIGDATMAFWGAPLPCDDKVFRACQAAEDMVAGARELAERTEKRFGCAVTFGVGVHVGRAVVGSIGSPDRKDYTAIGDTVNVASRLESAAPPGAIYVSRAVVERLGDRARVTPLNGSVRLKGKSSDFEVFTLDGLKHDGD